MRIQLQEMSKLCKRITIVTHTPEILQPATSGIEYAELAWIADIYRNTGPLGGIHAACQAASEPYVWIVGCDMPFISSEAAGAMYEQCLHSGAQAIVPFFSEKTHPLYAIYKREAAADAAEKLLEQGSYKLMGLMDHLSVLPVNEPFFAERDLDTRFVTNVNTPDDYDKILKIM